MMENDLQKQLQLLCTAKTTEEELLALQSLNVILARPEACDEDPDTIEREFLTQSKTVLEEGNPYPRFQVGNTISAITDVSYILSLWLKPNLLITGVVIDNFQFFI